MYVSNKQNRNNPAEILVCFYPLKQNDILCELQF